MSSQPFTVFIADVIILWLLKSGITMLILNKDDVEFVTEFPCLLGHPVPNEVHIQKEGGQRDPFPA